MEEERIEGKQKYLSIKELAEHWGVSANFVRRLIWDEELTHIRFGRAIRISLAAAQAYATRRAKKSTTRFSKS